MPDGKAAASSVVGMDHCVRTFHQFTGLPLHIAVTPGEPQPSPYPRHQTLGSIAPGKQADLVVLDRELGVRQVYLAGKRIVKPARSRLQLQGRPMVGLPEHFDCGCFVETFGRGR